MECVHSDFTDNQQDVGRVGGLKKNKGSVRETGAGGGKRERTGEQLQWYSLWLRKEKEKIGPGRLPESWVNHQKIAGTTWVCTNTGTLSVPISSPQLSFTVQEVQSEDASPCGAVERAEKKNRQMAGMTWWTWLAFIRGGRAAA